MNKLTLSTLLLLLVTSAASAGTDFQCMNDCSRAGYQYGLCRERCTYESPPTRPPRTDQQCMSNCQQRGYTWQLCKQHCGY